MKEGKNSLSLLVKVLEFDFISAFQQKAAFKLIDNDRAVISILQVFHRIGQMFFFFVLDKLKD